MTHRLAPLLLVLVGLSLTGPAAAQDPDYVIRLDNQFVAPAATFLSTVYLDNSGDDVLGVSFSVCSDPAFLDPLGATPGAFLQSLNGGDGPDAFGVVVEPDGLGVLIIPTLIPGPNIIPPGLGLTLVDLEYEVLAPSGATALTFCDTIGDPPVETIVVINPQSVVPVQQNATVSIGGVDDPLFTFRAPTTSGTFDPATGVGAISIELTIADANDTSSDTRAFSMGLGHDPQTLIATLVEPTGVLALLNGGAGPDFFVTSLLTEGITLGTVYSFLGTESIVFGPTGEPVIAVLYETNPTVLQGSDAVTTPLTWRDDLDIPPVENIIVDGDSFSIAPFLVHGEITLVPSGVTFRRGDCNPNGIYGLDDPIFLLAFLFTPGSPPPPCAAACDANDSVSIDIADAVQILSNLFTSGPDPAPPFPGCGPDPTPDVGCASYPPC